MTRIPDDTPAPAGAPHPRHAASLQGLLRDAVTRNRAGWQRADLPGGAWLWRRGEPARSIAWVEQGALRVLVDGDERGTVGPGELLGEASAFTLHDSRMADLQTTQPTVLWTLDRGRLQTLRDDDPAWYDALLDAAIATLSQRLVANEHELSRRRAGGPDAGASASGLLQRLVHGLKGRSAPPPLSGLLGELLLLDSGGPAVVQALCAHAEPLHVEADQALCVEGDAATSVFIVASGAFRVTLEATAGGAIELGRVGPHALLGTGAMLQGGRRTATVLATESSWVYELSRASIDALPADAWRALASLFAVVLGEQLSRAHAAATRAKGARGTIALEDAMPLLGELQSYTPERRVRVPWSMLRGPGAAIELDAETRARVDLVRRSVIGADVALDGPFGRKRVVYADYTASGRPLAFIEDYLRERVMPLYANTHTEASASGLQTTEFREQARALVREGVGAGDDDAVVFVGSGATGAINKLVRILGLRIPHELDARHGLSARIPPHQRPVVFVGPYEHHSNLLPWRDTIADVVTIGLDADGQIDLHELQTRLVEHAARPLKIGTFSAASNVTGIRADTVAVATLLHRYGALSFWDYAAAGPYVRIDMNPSGPGVDAALAYKDAIFLSPHKFVGGPGTPGVLVLKRRLADNAVPGDPGGGTVDFVTAGQALYSSAIESREEGGTPDILGSIRCGLAFQVKAQVGTDAIEAIEHDQVRRAIAAWRSNPAIEIVGNPDAERISITSFLVRHGRRFLHYGLVVALLNDVFGIQARGGCSCAGPYGGLLLGLGQTSGRRLLACAGEGWSSIKPGWARVNFNYFIGDDELRYIVSAVHLVALHGWALGARYDFDARSGLWTHRDTRRHGHSVADLHELRIDGGRAHWHGAWPTAGATRLMEQLTVGRALLEAALDEAPPDVPAMALPDHVEELRWFPLPHELAADLRRDQRHRQVQMAQG